MTVGVFDQNDRVGEFVAGVSAKVDHGRLQSSNVVERFLPRDRLLPAVFRLLHAFVTRASFARLSGQGPHQRRESWSSPASSSSRPHVDDNEKRELCKALAAKHGGDPDAMFFEVAKARPHSLLRERECSL